MALKRLKLIDVLNEDGTLLRVTEDAGSALHDMINYVADAFVVYEVLHNGRTGTSGHKNILRFYTRKDLEEDIHLGNVKIEMR